MSMFFISLVKQRVFDMIAYLSILLFHTRILD